MPSTTVRSKPIRLSHKACFPTWRESYQPHRRKTKVLITTTENELDIYDAATNSVNAHNQGYSRFAAADPVNPRFALFDSNGFDIVDINLQQLGALEPPDIANNSGANPYAFQFSADGTQLFVARSGIFRGSYAVQTVDAVNYTRLSSPPHKLQRKRVPRR